MAKDIILRPISSGEANALVRRVHYSGKVVRNSQVHIGVFHHGRLHGAIQFGPPLDRRKLLGLVRDTPWNGMLELNRMAFDDHLPHNSESRALGVVMRMLRKHRSDIQWVVSFADATQCGDGTIYRAAGFVLTAIRRSRNLCRLPNGAVIHKMTLDSNPCRPRPELGGRSYFDISGGHYDWSRYVAEVRGTITQGHQLRYLYFLDPLARDRLQVPIIPFSEIQRRGAGMYLGEPRAGSDTSDTAADHAAEGGAAPTPALSLQEARCGT